MSTWKESRNCNINEPFCLMPFFNEMKLKRLLVDSLYLSPVCNLSPNPMIYCQLLVRTRASRAGQEISYHFRSSIFVADLATRKCSTDGFWISEDGLEAPDPSWTNFTGCFTADVAKVIDGYYGKNSSSMFWKHTNIISLVSSNIFSTFQVISILWHIILVFSKWSDTVYPLYPYSHHSVFYLHLGKKN